MTGSSGRYEAAGGWLLFLVALLLPTAAVALPHGASGLFTVTALFALGTLARLPQRWHALSPAERWLVLAMLVFFLAPLASLANADDLHEFWKRYDRHWRFLGFVPIFLLARGLPQGWQPRLLRALLWGCVLAGPVALALGAYELAWLGKERAEGAYHPIVFGDLTALYGLLLIAWAAAGRYPRRHRIAWGLAALPALAASVSSGTRGAWLGVLAMLALLPLVLPRSRAGRMRALALASVVGLAGGWLALQVPMVASKVEETLWWVGAYLSGFDAPSSSQARFELWRLAWDLWRAHPWVGEGFGDFPAFVRAACRGELPYGVAWPLTHAHDVYLQFLATTGLVGFLALMWATILAPLRLAGLGLRVGERTAAVLLLVFVTAFAVFGLTEDWTARSPFTAAYSVLLALLAAASAAATATHRHRGRPPGSAARGA